MSVLQTKITKNDDFPKKFKQNLSDRQARVLERLASEKQKM